MTAWALLWFIKQWILIFFTHPMWLWCGFHSSQHNWALWYPFDPFFCRLFDVSQQLLGEMQLRFENFYSISTMELWFRSHQIGTFLRVQPCTCLHLTSLKICSFSSAVFSRKAWKCPQTKISLNSNIFRDGEMWAAKRHFLISSTIVACFVEPISLNANSVGSTSLAFVTRWPIRHGTI